MILTEWTFLSSLAGSFSVVLFTWLVALCSAVGEGVRLHQHVEQVLLGRILEGKSSKDKEGVMEGAVALIDNAVSVAKVV